MCLIKIFYTKIVQILMLWLYTKLNYYIFEIICMFVGHLLHFINPKYVIINNSYFLKICICNSWRRSCFFKCGQFWQHCFCQWSLKNYCFKEYSTFLDYLFICFHRQNNPLRGSTTVSSSDRLSPDHSTATNTNITWTSITCALCKIMFFVIARP